MRDYHLVIDGVRMPKLLTWSQANADYERWRRLGRSVAIWNGGKRCRWTARPLEITVGKPANFSSYRKSA
jgi:hypothetical protein